MTAQFEGFLVNLPWTYKINTSGELEISYYSGENQIIVIPSGISGYKLKVIGDVAFAGNANISMPDSITRIGYASFTGSKVEKISFSRNLQEIGEFAFESCFEIEDINLPSAVTVIKKEAFGGCKALKNINLQDTSIEIVSEDTFHGCIELEKITLPNTVTTIGDNAFTGCTKLNSITIPKTTTTISDNAFDEIDRNTLVIYGYGNSYAQNYAKANGIKFVAVDEPIIPFTDIKTTDWYYGSVKYVYNNKIILGKTNTLFKPNDKLTRGELVTILWRMAGNPSTKTENKFKDVKTGQYYYEAVKWVAANKVVNGYSEEKFGPNDNITREQLAIMLNNYARYKKKEINKLEDISKYKDEKSVSSYAVSAIRWAIGNKIISGKDEGTRIDPRGLASRAEAAAMIQNYCINVK